MMLPQSGHGGASSSGRRFGFNIVTYDPNGLRVQQNPVLRPCEECVTGKGNVYAFPIPKHKSGHNIFVEMVHQSGLVGSSGPAVRDCTP